MKTTFLVEIESEFEVDAETLEQNIYYRFPTSVDNVKVEKVQPPTQPKKYYQCPNCGSDSKDYHEADCPANPHNVACAEIHT